MEISLSYEDIQKIVMKKFNINSTLNPDPLWYSEFDDEFVTLNSNKLENIVLKLRVYSDLV